MPQYWTPAGRFVGSWQGKFGLMWKAHGTFVGGPYSSWFTQLPRRPIACANSTLGAMKSRYIRKSSFLMSA